LDFCKKQDIRAILLKTALVRVSCIQITQIRGETTVKRVQESRYILDVSINGNQITFGAADFQPHTPTLAPVLASLDQEKDLTIESSNFCVGSLGSARLSGLIKSGPLAGKTTIAATPEITVGSSSKGNPPVSFKPKKGSIVEELREITENLNLEESLGLTNRTTSEKFDNILEKDFRCT
jgi:hypothetical protein